MYFLDFVIYAENMSNEHATCSPSETCWASWCRFGSVEPQSADKGGGGIIGNTSSSLILNVNNVHTNL